MSIYTPELFVADQLRAAAPSAEWDAGGVDRARELAQLFLASGVNDLSKLTFERVSAAEHVAIITPRVREYQRGRCEAAQFRGGSIQDNAWCNSLNLPVGPEHDYWNIPFRFRYENRPFGFLGDANLDGSISNQMPLFQATGYGAPLIAWSARGHGNVGYVIMPGARGMEIRPQWASSSDASAVRTFVLQGASMVLSVVTAGGGFAIANQIGTAVLGAEFAAAYPALANAVGQTAISTVFNGGDVGAAVKSTLAGAAAGIGGNYVSTLTDSPLLGTIAQTATRTALVGGDPVQAALSIAQGYAAQQIQQTPQPAPSAPSTPGDPMDFFNLDALSPDMLTAAPMPAQFEPAFPQFASMPAFDFGSVFETSDFGVPGFANDAFSLYPADGAQFAVPTLNFDTGNLFSGDLFSTGPFATPGFGNDPFSFYPADAPVFDTPILQGPAPAPTATYLPTQENIDSDGSGFWDFAMAALKIAAPIITQKYMRPVAAPPRAITSSGAIDPARLPPGVPTAMPDGSVIINRGDGQYTVTTPRGEVITRPLPGLSRLPGNSGAGGIISGDNSALLIGGGLVVGALLLTMRKG